MNDMDEYYMKIGKYAPKPEPKEKDSFLFTYGYLVGAAIAFVFWGSFLMWVVSRT